MTLKPRAGQLPRTQSRPKKTLRFRSLAPQPSRAFAWCGWPIHESQLYRQSRIFELLPESLQDTPRAGLRTQRAFFNAALALLGMVAGIYDMPDLSLG